MSTREDVCPYTIATVGRIQKTIPVINKPLLVLFDSGSSSTWMSRKALPRGILGTTGPKITSVTMAGTFSSSQQVRLENIILPEFYKQRSLEQCNAYVFQAPCRYDIIIGRDVLRQLGIIMDFDSQVMTWDDHTHATSQ